MPTIMKISPQGQIRIPFKIMHLLGITKGDYVEVPVLAVEVTSKETSLSSTLKDRMKWFHSYTTLGIQVVDKRGVLKKYDNNTWIVSVEKLLHLLP